MNPNEGVEVLGQGIELYRDAKREWRWRARASNGKIVADSSEGYINFLDCLNGLVAAAEIIGGAK